jgi:hypothetical protein|tara:strand:- start:645 stop:872 length:228 start_codon:yes stop_codon:yes gene_type:complete
LSKIREGDPATIDEAATILRRRQMENGRCHRALVRARVGSKQLAMQMMRKRVGWDMVLLSIARLLDVRHIDHSQN